MMKKENDELTDLFRSQLENASMTPRDDFWDTLQNDISLVEKKRRRLMFYRTVAAASVLLIIGAASAMFVFFRPQSDAPQMIAKSNTAIVPQSASTSPHRIEIQPQIPAKALVAQTVVSSQSSNNGNSSSNNVASGSRLAAMSHKASLSNTAENNVADDDSTVTVSIHMTVRVRENSDYANNESNDNNGIWQAGGLGSKNQTDANAASQSADKQLLASASEASKPWMLKAGIGFSAPTKSGFDAPVVGSLTLEKQLNKYLALESGLKYTYLHSDAQTLHYLSVPVKANVTLAKSPKVDFYATAGGSADKCISASHGSSGEKIQFTAMAGLGLRYRINTRLSLYTEPTFTHYFNNDAKYTSYRTEKNNAFNVIGGLCMNF